MKRSRRIFLILLSVIFSHLSLPADTIYRKVWIKNVCIQAEIADSQDKKQLGLMNRENLSDDQGMLFLFDKQDLYHFWMKDMKFPLDIIWISHDKTIVDINTDVLPCKEQSCESFSSRTNVQYVLEVKAGFAAQNQLKIGDHVRF